VPAAPVTASEADVSNLSGGESLSMTPGREQATLRATKNKPWQDRAEAMSNHHLLL